MQIGRIGTEWITAFTVCLVVETFSVKHTSYCGMVSAQKAQWITDSAVVLEGWFSEIVLFPLHLSNLLFPELEEWSLWPNIIVIWKIWNYLISLVSELEWKDIGSNYHIWCKLNLLKHEWSYDIRAAASLSKMSDGNIALHLFLHDICGLLQWDCFSSCM